MALFLVLFIKLSRKSKNKKSKTQYIYNVYIYIAIYNAFHANTLHVGMLTMHSLFDRVQTF